MKTFFHLISALLFGLSLSVSIAHASLDSAEITRLYNDVRVRFSNSSERPAQIGDRIAGQTAVRTGMKSRTELKFNDDTLTRLGANTVFSFERGSRNMEVGSGTLFLQVPRDAGGATINTAAVTAAVTGTTIMIEVDANNVVKIIVLEGTLELSLTGDSRVKQTLTAGQMIVMEPNAQTIPLPVNVDLELLVKTSKLINEEEFDKLPPEAKTKIAEAVGEQQELIQNGELSKTNLVIPGAGSSVILTDVNFERRLEEYLENLGGSPPPPGSTPPSASTPPQDMVTLPPQDNQLAEITGPVLQPGLWNIAEGTIITTNPSITDGPRVGEGTIYVPLLAGSFTQWAFGTPDTASRGLFQQALNEKNGWAVFLLEEILVSGVPTVNTDGPRQVIFASPRAINIEGPRLPPGSQTTGETFLLDDMGLSSVVFATQDAPINTRNLDIVGFESDLGLFANGPGGDINIDSFIFLDSGTLAAYAGGDLNANPNSSLNANVVDFVARGNINIDNSNIQANDFFINAGGSITVTNSSELLLMTTAAGTGGLLEIASRNGNVVLDGGSQIRADGPMQTLEIRADNGNIRVGSTDPNNTATAASLSASTLVAFRAAGDNQPTISFRDVAVNVPITFGGDERINILARGPGASVLFGGFNNFNASNIRVYAEGSGSLIRFTDGTTNLNGDRARLAAQTIRVDGGATVNITAMDIGIFANQHQYNLNGNDESMLGILNANSELLTIGSYDQR